jgi:hypothetical protein
MVNSEIFVIAPSDGCPAIANLISLDTSLVIPTRVLRFEVSGLHRRTPVRPVLLTGQTSTHRSDRSDAAAPPSSVLRSWLCGSTKEPSGFLVNHWKPRELGVASASPLMTRLPRSPGSTLVLWLNQETVHDFILLFLPPCGPHLDSASHWVPRTKPTCLLHTWRPHRQRPFTLFLHLH